MQDYRKGRKQMKILVINGPNLNFLGIREKNVYGTIIDRIQDAYFDGTEGIVINPGAYTHYSYAIHDALASITVPKMEIHISNIMEREDFRKVSVTAPACDGQIYGKGLNGYLEAIDRVIALAEAKK